jgi:hypothetical protein
MEKRGGKRMRFKIRQYGVPSKYRDCEHVSLSGRSIRLLSASEITEFTRHVAVVIAKRVKS